MTLAAEVMMITASTSRMLPKVSWPIENANERVFGEFGGDSADMAVQTGLLTAPIYDVFRPRGNLPGAADRPENCDNPNRR